MLSRIIFFLFLFFKKLSSLLGTCLQHLTLESPRLSLLLSDPRTKKVTHKHLHLLIASTLGLEIVSSSCRPQSNTGVSLSSSLPACPPSSLCAPTGESGISKELYGNFFFCPFFPSSTKPIMVMSLGRNRTNYREISAEFKESWTCLCVMTSDFIRFLHRIIASSLFLLFRIKCCQTRLPNWIAAMELKRWKKRPLKGSCPFLLELMETRKILTQVREYSIDICHTVIPSQSWAFKVSGIHILWSVLVP